jgi:hypothetical protein
MIGRNPGADAGGIHRRPPPGARPHFPSRPWTMVSLCCLAPPCSRNTAVTDGLLRGSNLAVRLGTLRSPDRRARSNVMLVRSAVVLALSVVEVAKVLGDFRHVDTLKITCNPRVPHGRVVREVGQPSLAPSFACSRLTARGSRPGGCDSGWFAYTQPPAQASAGPRDELGPSGHRIALGFSLGLGSRGVIALGARVVVASATPRTCSRTERRCVRREPHLSQLCATKRPACPPGRHSWPAFLLFCPPEVEREWSLGRPSLARASALWAGCIPIVVTSGLVMLYSRLDGSSWRVACPRRTWAATESQFGSLSVFSCCGRCSGCRSTAGSSRRLHSGAGASRVMVLRYAGVHVGIWLVAALVLAGLAPMTIQALLPATKTRSCRCASLRVPLLFRDV